MHSKKLNDHLLPLVPSVVGSFLGLRFPLRLFGRGEELHTTLALELARSLARSGCIRFWMVSVVVDEVGRMDGRRTRTTDRLKDGWHWGDFQRTFAHLVEMDVKCVAFRAT